MTAVNKLYFKAEKELFLILTGIGDEIYSTVDASKHSKRRCGQPLKMENTWSLITPGFTKLMNELDKEHLQVHQCKRLVQFLQQLLPDMIRPDSANPLALLRLLNHIQITLAGTYLKIKAPSYMQSSFQDDQVQLSDKKAKRSPKPVTLNLVRFFRDSDLNSSRGIRICTNELGTPC
ncbi:hypothetical protein Tco_1081949 [Tanacetum coccineum]|uniref:Uncharacterized protein n=1 Tax=Tanacetum coccineum TaxID=301880 RepID=A0ABQ5I0A3_9ASTR